MIAPEQIFAPLHVEFVNEKAPSFTVEWTVSQSLPYLDGHFPGTPILPAIAIVDASTYILQRALQQPHLKLKSITMAKFLSPIRPGQKLRIACDRLVDLGWQLKWADSEGKVLASLSVHLDS